MISKFADDSKIRGIVDSAQNLQWDLDLPGKWLRNGKTRSIHINTRCRILGRLIRVELS